MLQQHQGPLLTKRSGSKEFIGTKPPNTDLFGVSSPYQTNSRKQFNADLIATMKTNKKDKKMMSSEKKKLSARVKEERPEAASGQKQEQFHQVNKTETASK